MLTVGEVQENCFIARPDGGDHAVIVDPGEEAPRLLAALEEWGVELDAILLTHTHFDHVGAVAADRPRHRRAGLLPAARGARSCRTSTPSSRGRASARTSRGIPSTPSPAARRSSSPG